MLGLAHDVNAFHAPARARARHVEHAERNTRTERNADADKNSRRGFLLVPRYLELGQRLLNERRRRENRDVRGETASDSPHQNKGGVGPDGVGAPAGLGLLGCGPCIRIAQIVRQAAPAAWNTARNNWRWWGQQFQRSAQLWSNHAKRAWDAIRAMRSSGQTTKLYRAVDPAEYEQLARTGKFQASPNSLGGKFFAENAADAGKWGEKLHGAGKFRIVEAELPKAAADQLMRWGRLDGIGPARYGELEQLGEAVVRPLQ